MRVRAHPRRLDAWDRPKSNEVECWIDLERVTAHEFIQEFESFCILVRGGRNIFDVGITGSWAIDVYSGFCVGTVDYRVDRVANH
jgi:hypothetical protein